MAGSERRKVQRGTLLPLPLPNYIFLAAREKGALEAPHRRSPHEKIALQESSLTPLPELLPDGGRRRLQRGASLLLVALLGRERGSSAVALLRRRRLDAWLMLLLLDGEGLVRSSGGGLLR